MKYPIVEGTPALLRDYAKLIEVLKNQGIPFDWFADQGSNPETTHSNKLIQSHVSSVFGSDYERVKRKSREFRKYLRENNISW